MRKYIFFSLILVSFLFLNCQKASENPTSPAATNTQVPPTSTITPYPTSTPNPGGDNINGTLTLPVQQTGKSFAVVLDNDFDGGNGYIAAGIGVCDSGTTVNYSFTFPVGGPYYLMALVDVDGNGLDNGPQNGDYFGYYGGSGLNPPGSANVSISTTPITCDINLAIVPTFTPTNTSTPTISPTPTNTVLYGTVSGNLLLPQAKDGRNWWVGIDDNFNPIDGCYSNIGVCGSSTSVPYSVTAPAGTYFIYAWVDSDGSGNQGTNIGDYLGSYGETYPNFPGTPNVTIINGSTTSNININLVAATANITGRINFPSAATGADMAIIVDNNTDGGDGFLSIEYVPSLGSNNYFDYQIVAPLPGTYYLFGFVDKSDPPTIWEGPSSGDYVGFYGSPTVVDINPANNYSFTFNLNTY